MKTFEERYTAWIDGQLTGSALLDFEQELTRRATAGEAHADKTDATRLHTLLNTHLRAPEMTNADFFGHQLLQRIEADRMSVHRKTEPRTVRAPLFAWPFAKLAGLGAAFLFVTVALYYGLMPEQSGKSTPLVQTHAPSQRPTIGTDTPAIAVQPVQTLPGPGNSQNDNQFAKLETPVPPVVITQTTDIQDVHVTEPSVDTTTTATPLHYQASNVNVLWINGLDYLPNVPDDTASAGLTVPAPAPAASANP